MQATDHSLKFIVPATLPPGVFAYRIATASGTATGLLNRPAIWWTQGNRGKSTSPGSVLHLYGKNLAAVDAGGAVATVVLKGPRASSGGGERPMPPLQTVALTAQGDAYEAAVTLPAELPVGDYEVFLHNGRGGSGAWSEVVTTRVEKLPPWPQTVFNVKDFGAEGTGVKDDIAAVRAALTAARRTAAGWSLSPRPVPCLYHVERAAVYDPAREKREWVNLLWPDFPKPPEALIRGKNNFGL